MKSKEDKKEEAEERQKYWASLSTKEKIESLDRRFGPNVGAKKQREKLEKMLKKESK